MLVIPAIDLINGRCVRLSQGDYAQQTTYDAGPEEMVETYVAHGFHRIHIVDLDGAKASAPRNLETLKAVARIPGAKIEWGGGVKSEEALRDVLEAGAAYVVVGSLAVKEPETFARWLDTFGPERIVLGADVRNGKVSINGWLDDTELSIESLIDRFTPHGLNQVICTDISRDGMLQGPATDLYLHLQTAYPSIDFTVSGGISGEADLTRLHSLGLRRVIVGKALYEGRITLAQMSNPAFSHAL
ncbi:MAG: 1-(5-phosphoribosyl)-5-[(5-phosphoribosylamino)methylideneamino]imidazole-4-carboxamide isomerase [Alloprevotella sp.]|nr:1-(5-phosphoribosyl)-5-[(5-phosphoribosylamino)methylideneamino]imidazole-4-carboxamide isomerase [Alloprevotella sp.]